MTPALALAEAVVARGHEGTEAHVLARALLVSEAWRAYWCAMERHTFADGCSEICPDDPMVIAVLADATAQLAEKRARLEALGEKP